MVTALNKIDLLDDRSRVVDEIDDFELAVPVSAVTGEGIPQLLAVAERELDRNTQWCDVVLPYSEGRLISLFHEHGIVERIEHTADGVRLVGRLPAALIGELRPWLPAPEAPEEAESTFQEEPTFEEHDRL
jgi:GTP-binding protein HflX